MKRRTLLYGSLCLLLGTLFLFCGMAGAAALKVDNLEDVYIISVNEELALPYPAWSGGDYDPDRSYFGNSNMELNKENDPENGVVIFSSDQAGVYPVEAWIYSGNALDLKWVTIVVKDTDGSVPAPGIGSHMQYYYEPGGRWYAGLDDKLLNITAESSAYCLFRITSYTAYYNYYQDFPEWTVEHISGPEYEYTSTRMDWINYEDEDGQISVKPDGDLQISFTAADQTEDAVYRVTVSWHGTEVSQLLTVHPLVPDRWDLCIWSVPVNESDLIFYAGGTENTEYISVSNYGYFRKQYGCDPDLQLIRVSGQDLDFSVSTNRYENEYCNYELHFRNLPLTEVESEYDVVCTWGDTTDTIRLNIYIYVPESGIPSGTIQKDNIILEVGETYEVRQSDYIILPAGWELEGEEIYRYWNYSGSDIIEVEESGDVVTLTALQPGYACFAMYVSCSNYRFEDTFVITVTENGIAPPLQEMILLPYWPKSAQVGDTWDAGFSWWNAVPPGTWRMEVEHNGERTVFTRDSSGTYYTFTENGEYVLYCYLTDGFGRTAECFATAVVSDPCPLELENILITASRENGENNHDVWLQTNYSGGYQMPSLHYKIFAKNAAGEWYMTWEQDGNPDQHFWIGEDGEHYFEVSVTDGVTSETAVTEIILLGSGPVSQAVLELPDDLVLIEEDAFAGDIRLQKVLVGARVKRIEAGAFAGCSSLTQIFIPSGVEYIANSAFRDVTDLTIISDSEDSAAAAFAAENGFEFRVGSGLD